MWFSSTYNDLSFAVLFLSLSGYFFMLSPLLFQGICHFSYEERLGNIVTSLSFYFLFFPLVSCCILFFLFSCLWGCLIVPLVVFSFFSLSHIYVLYKKIYIFVTTAVLLLHLPFHSSLVSRLFTLEGVKCIYVLIFILLLSFSG